MMIHPLDIPRPKDRYEHDLYDQTARRDNILGLILAVLGIIAIPTLAVFVAWWGGGW